MVRRCFSHGCSVSLVVTPGCSFPTSWRCVSRVCFHIMLLWPDPGCGSCHCSSVSHFTALWSSFASALLEFLLLWLLLPPLLGLALHAELPVVAWDNP
ncbi:hypothetical protein Taro_023342 [Colocasia esculenta]|uniref:Uncharacterized protein n=1 Tax=Colocasia esculenta TaxID=4460 RepID=A0A843V3K5_COLES|nr:hypothetical protein [Colocasia esculenta]